MAVKILGSHSQARPNTSSEIGTVPTSKTNLERL